MGKALFYDPYLDTVGGGERYTFTLAQHLLDTSWKVDVVWNGDGVETIKEKFKTDIKIGMDVAASTLFDGENYLYKSPKMTRKTEEQIDFILSLIKDYNLFYVEDPLHEDDFEGFSKITKSAKKCLIVGDDLTATHSERLQKAIENKSANAVIVKPNQNGSLLETKEFIQLAQKNKITTIISHRSGETSDATIADLAVAWNIPYIKTGILGKERFAKLNRLLKIERMIRK